MDELPAVIYACFVLHNYCELNKESINEEIVRTSIRYDREFQPQTTEPVHDILMRPKVKE